MSADWKQCYSSITISSLNRPTDLAAMAESKYRRFMNRILMMLHIIKRERPVTADEIQAAIEKAQGYVVEHINEEPLHDTLFSDRLLKNP